MKRKDVCVGCSAVGPDAKSTSTMAASGWRLSTSDGESGRPRVEWYCPKCWEEKTGSAPIKGASKPR